MSITATRPVSFAIAARLRTLQERLFAGKGPQGRLYRDLIDLPDHLLLDIGVDPRSVPSSADDVIARPDLLYTGPAAAVFRTAAKS